MNPEPEAPRDSAGKMIVSGLLVLLGVAGLLASLCGGMFTLMAISDRGAGEFVIGIALPSLIIGGLVAWASFRAVGRRHRTGPYEDEVATPSEAREGASAGPETREED